ncbi:hypothetical protein [Roseibium sp. RKSG952]|uniref:hypothetical protein n=1 Tax=Roseibium sp. RKSG952 TaxID=2529384 RepID=UPI0012BB907C|nr:hypothetical protein [Roseibium sp. RKSG952]
MTAFVEPLDIARVERGEAGEDAQYLFRMWRENKGLIVHDQRMTWISRRLMLFVPSTCKNDVPKSTFIGRQTVLRHYFPDATDTPQPPHCLPLDYRQRQAFGYCAANQREPWFDIQRTGDLLGENTPDLTLERLILKFHTKSGFERLFCLVKLVSENGQCGLSDPRYPQPSFPQQSGFRLSKQVRRRPSAGHVDMRV